MCACHHGFTQHQAESTTGLTVNRLGSQAQSVSRRCHPPIPPARYRAPHYTCLHRQMQRAAGHQQSSLTKGSAGSSNETHDHVRGGRAAARASYDAKYLSARAGAIATGWIIPRAQKVEMKTQSTQHSLTINRHVLQTQTSWKMRSSFALDFLRCKLRQKRILFLYHKCTELQVRAGTTTRICTGNCWNSYEFHRWIQKFMIKCPDREIEIHPATRARATHAPACTSSTLQVRARSDPARRVRIRERGATLARRLQMVRPASQRARTFAS
eukprot:COSAG02_NODE_802_length_17030_cov_37.485500_8_plen_270_part_00